jgi:hypothetical protein
MLTQNELTELTQDLASEANDALPSEDVAFRAATLEVLWQYPSADARVLPYLERLLYDETPCLLGIPYIFGEIRWLAAKALAAERAALGINEPVRVRVVRPAETMDIMRAADAADFSLRGGVDGLLVDLAILRDMGYMPMIELELWPLGKPSVVAQKPRYEPELVPA